MKNYLMLLVISLLIFSCSGKRSVTEVEAELPENPEKVTFEWSKGGGMLPEGENIYISADSSYWYMWRNEYSQKLYFTTSEAELKGLYQTCLTLQFDKIEQKEQSAVCD